MSRQCDWSSGDACDVAFVVHALPEAVSGQDTVTPIRSTTVVDLPNDAELFAAYQRDRSNQKVQSWGQYRDWVQTFYKGNLVSEGWIKFGEVTVGKVKSVAARQTVIAQINELGRIIGLEWAKDSSVRKISTTELRRWNDVMVTARRATMVADNERSKR